MGSAIVTLNEAPTVSNIQTVCNAVNTAYTVIFEIIGGDPNTYVVLGGTGTLTGNIFTSDEIPSGDVYNFDVNDANNCGPVNVTGVFDCGCATNSGTMDLTALELCENQAATATHNGDETLDANDLLEYVLHDGSSASLGNVIAMNNVPEFSFQVGMM